MSINGISQSTINQLSKAEKKELEQLENNDDVIILADDNSTSDIILDKASQDELATSYNEALAQAQESYNDFDIEIENIEEIDEASISEEDRKPYSEFTKKEDTTTNSTDRKPQSDFGKRVTKEKLDELGVDERLQAAILDGRINFDINKYGVTTDENGYISYHPKFNIATMTGMGPDRQIFSEEEIQAMKDSNASMEAKVDDLIKEQTIYHSNPLLNKLKQSDLDPTLYKAVLEGRFDFEPDTDHWQPYYDTEKNNLMTSYFYIDDMPGSDAILTKEEKEVLNKHNETMYDKEVEMRKIVDKLDNIGVDKRLYNAILDGRLPFDPDRDNYNTQRLENDYIDSGVMWNVDLLKQSGEFTEEELQAVEEHNEKNSEAVNEIGKEITNERQKELILKDIQNQIELQSELTASIKDYNKDIESLKNKRKENNSNAKTIDKQISKLEKRKEKTEKNLQKEGLNKKKEEKLLALKEKLENKIQEKEEELKALRQDSELVYQELEETRDKKTQTKDSLKSSKSELKELENELKEFE